MNRRRSPDGVVVDLAERRPSRRQVDALARALSELAPFAADGLLDRLAVFVAKHEPAAGLWVVVTATSGPWLCRVGQIGLLAQRELVPVLAVAVDDIYLHLGGEPA